MQGLLPQHTPLTLTLTLTTGLDPRHTLRWPQSDIRRHSLTIGDAGGSRVQGTASRCRCYAPRGCREKVGFWPPPRSCEKSRCVGTSHAESGKSKQKGEHPRQSPAAAVRSAVAVSTGPSFLFHFCQSILSYIPNRSHFMSN